MNSPQFLTWGSLRLAARAGASGWSLAVEQNEVPVWSLPQPAQAERGCLPRSVPFGSPYCSLENHTTGLGWIARARLTCQGSDLFFEDHWTLEGTVLKLFRSVTVRGNLEGGFLTRITWDRPLREPWPDLSLFVPGMLYGSLVDVAPGALGSRNWREQGVRVCRIREDRMAAPLLVADPADGNPLAVLNSSPDGTSTTEDLLDTSSQAPLVQSGLRLGSLTAEFDGSRLAVGFVYPGDEGEVTYTGDTFPGGQIRQWRGRFHPWVDGESQTYSVAFRFDFPPGISQQPAPAWRWAWNTLKPRLVPAELEEVRLSSLRLLANHLADFGPHRGIPLSMDATTGQTCEHKALFGFTGRNTDAAWFLLEGATDTRVPAADRERLREAGSAILNSFCTLRMNPPQAEGFDKEGQPYIWPYLGCTGIVYLRSLAEAGHSALRSWEIEKKAGRAHPSWRQWAEDLADFLLRVQRRDGSLARGFFANSDREANDSPESTLCAVRFLVECALRLDKKACLPAAVAAGEFAWQHGHQFGRFVGGTIDNPDVVDKEAGTIALDAYLALADSTGEKRFVHYAKAAAAFAETWIYVWKVPMSENPTPHFPTDATTVGMQLIATGHSLVDSYMAFDAGNYLRLHRLTGDDHDREVAEILLHNTKGAISTLAHPYDLAGPGWQQEHWSLAPPRGRGLHRLWLPWVTVSHLHGMATYTRELNRH